jgi:endogenous inhibitor of DNA gyrase (YacG/DUF329 family)
MIDAELTVTCDACGKFIKFKTMPRWEFDPMTGMYLGDATLLSLQYDLNMRKWRVGQDKDKVYCPTCSTEVN